MQKLEVINKPLMYDGKKRQVGDVFECQDRFVQPLMVLGRVKIYVEPKPEPQPRQVRRKRTASTRNTTTKTSYQTREMSADDLAIQESQV